MLEQWKVIEDFPRYQVSNLGRIKSTIGSEKILNPCITKKGYRRIQLSGKSNIKGKYIQKDFMVHRLVAKYFCENYADNKEVHHKDRNRTNNKADNLLCVTKKEHTQIHKELSQENKKACDNSF